MFLEPSFRGQRSGWIEVITGCMFSGKTEELLRRIKRSNIAGQAVIVFKPSHDVRYSDDTVVSHDHNRVESMVVKGSKEMLDIYHDYDVVAIDEAQFFDDDILQVSEKMALGGKRVIIAGLDLDYKGIPFGPMPKLLAIAEYVTKVHAICPHCGNLATHSYRLSAETEQVLLGSDENYEPRCRTCYHMGPLLALRVRR